MKNTNYSHKTTPLPHQIEGIDYIEHNMCVALFDEQGLGKSKMVIDAIVNNIRDGELDGAIVICKKTLLSNWEEEIKIHSYLKSTVISGSKDNKFRSFLNRTDFYIVCYESVNSLLPLLLMLEENYKLAIILDESQKIKNPKTKLTTSILELAPNSKKRIIITGTPIANNPEDLWSQYYFLDGGKLLGTDFSQFCERFGINFKKTDVDEYESKLQKLKEIVSSNSLRRTKNILVLPDKEYIDIKIPMTPDQRELYDAVRDELLEELTNIANDQDICKLSTIDNQLVKLLRLVQITSNPRLIIEEFDDENPKIKFIDSKIEEIINCGEKCIIWTSFVNNIDELKNRYKNLNPATIHGGIPLELRNRDIQRFKTDPECKLLIANPSAAKEGLTLVSANNAIYLDRSFKMDDYLQSQDRIHRIGQSKTCHIIKLLCENSIDEYIDEILRRKELVLRFTVGDIDHIDEHDLITEEFIFEMLRD